MADPSPGGGEAVGARPKGQVPPDHPEGAIAAVGLPAAPDDNNYA